MSEGDVIVFVSPVRKVFFLFNKILSDGFIESVYGSNSDYLNGSSKFPYHTFDASMCRMATDKEKAEFWKLKANSQYNMKGSYA